MARDAVMIGRTAKGQWKPLLLPDVPIQKVRLAFKKAVADGGTFQGEQYEELRLCPKAGCKIRRFTKAALAAPKAPAKPKGKAKPKGPKKPKAPAKPKTVEPAESEKKKVPGNRVTK